MTEIRGDHDPLCFPAIRDVRIGDWGPSCFTCQVIHIARQQGHDGWYNQPSMWQEGYYQAVDDILKRVGALDLGAPGMVMTVMQGHYIREDAVIAAIKECPHEWNWYENEDTDNKPRWYCIRCGKDKS
jgi:hypothetical protein